jgi:carbamoyltransferase
VTEYLGYNALNGEGKLMGLAAYGEENKEIESALRSLVTTGADYDVTPLTGQIRIDPGIRILEETLGRPANKDTSSFSKWERDLAYVTQRLLEECVLSIVDRYIEEVETNKVCLAGGVAMNCKMNKLIREQSNIEHIFVQPVANDAGIALGAGMLEHDPKTVPEQSTVYLGPSYDTDKISRFLEQNKIPYTKPDNIATVTATALADGKLVGRFAGRMEFGPRALGNRSILADPRTVDSRNRVNKFVKHRENWRPFAPSIKADKADEYLVDACDAPFMIQTFDIRENRQEEIPAVLHPGDNTTRAQTVKPEQNPEYYELLDKFEAETEVPVLLNTSFNDHGEPIVRTPLQAVRGFFSMGLDVLVLEDILIKKESLGK